MPTIPNLSASDQVSAGDLFAMYIQNNGDARKVAMSVVQSYLQNNLDFQPGIQQYTTQYSVPSATGFSVQILNGDDNVHLILTPTGAFAAGTIVLPAAGLSGVVADKQQILVNTTQAITTLTINGNGATSVTGAPTTLAANAFFTLKYDQPTNIWYRIN
ncbi:hypothetical protein D9M71_159560 [compost metagenome]